jgi:primosomal protein N' (replication factor Y) (superfamily II helicase)
LGADGSCRRPAPRGLLSTISGSARHVASVLPLVPAWRVDKTFDYSIPDKLVGKVAHGTLVRIPFGGRVVRGFVLGLTVATVDEDLEVLKGVVIATPLVVPPLDDVVAALATRYVVPRGRAFQRLVPPRVRVDPDPGSDAVGEVAPQHLARYENGDGLLAALQARSAGTWCIRCLPGEDKGRLIAEMIAALPTGAALVLVPEVRYGSQVLDGVARLIPDFVRLDSAQDDGGRSAGWVSMAGGNRAGGGGRGAVLAPAPDLALLVVDEEHHQTYKEDRAPRFDARWVAIERATRQGALCVFMSASPSVEAGYSASTGRYASVVPTRTDRRRARPVVELVPAPEDRSIGPELHERMQSTLRSKEKVALLAPSPAFSRAVWCGECRRSLRCPRCESGLFYDRSASRVRCARCGFIDAAPEMCPTCGAAEFRFVGAGTERLQGQLAKAFPRAGVHRVDPADPSAMPRGPVDIYLTTWMGTKPVLRPDVSLVGVLDADWLMRRPDFRSAESGYQAMVEMAEWAGPADDGGRLVIQTNEPNHHALQAVVRADYDFFLQRELEQREELSYPPFVQLVRVTVAGSQTPETLHAIRSAIEPLSERILGPIDTTLGGDQPASQLLIKCADAEPVSKALRVILEGAPKGVRIAVDVDPR